LSLRFEALAEELESLFRTSLDDGLDDADFDDVAVRVFRFQFEQNGTYGRFCRRRGVTPASVASWREVPSVPTEAFRALPIVTGAAQEAERTFRTSGTTGGSEAAGAHYVRSLKLYRASTLPNFRRHLLPDVCSIRMVALLPSPDQAPESSLSHMAGVVGSELCTAADFVFDREHGLDQGRLSRLLHEAQRDGEPVLLVGTAFAFVHWLDHLGERALRFELPPGSRVMETGGFKGRSREVPREELYEGIAEAHGLRVTSIVNEYGMTEMLSQFYEPVMLDQACAAQAPSNRWHVAPPWVRTRILDPVSLIEKAPGNTGVLSHFDLANLGSVSSLLTEDVGVAVAGGFRLLGRAKGATPRGCSLAMEDFLRAGVGGE
jgi:acyl-protein synthetase LuxE